MDPDPNIDFSDLIHNKHFINWVLAPDTESDLYWGQILNSHPEANKVGKEAVFFIRILWKEGKELNDEAIEDLWNRIKKKKCNKLNRKILVQWLAAASVALIIGIGGWFVYLSGSSESIETDYKSLTKIQTLDNDVKLVFADKTEEVLTSEEPEIKYDSNGEIIVNSEKKLIHNSNEINVKSDQLNQLVVPNGKRSNLTLSDGTKLWLNSGSRAVFPVLFIKKEREIYIEGEAYLEVAKDATRPFYVMTDNIKVNVLGTKFNISAYPDDLSSSVVLVEGSVQAVINDTKLTMKPNHLLTYEKSTGATTLKETDVLMYISWKNGWLYCFQERMESISTKLSRYYNVRIEFIDDKAKDLTLTGKLDLKTECADVFCAISSTAPITFTVQENRILISSKKND